MGTDRLHIRRPHVASRSTSGGARARAHQPAHGHSQAPGQLKQFKSRYAGRSASACLLSQAARGRLQVQKRPL